MLAREGFAMIAQSVDVHPLQQSNAYAMVYVDAVKAYQEPPLRAASARIFPLGATEVTAPAIKGSAPCSISRAYSGGGGLIAECDGKPVSVAWPSPEDLAGEPAAGVRGHDMHDRFRQTLLKSMQAAPASAPGRPSTFTTVLLALSLMLLCFHAATFVVGHRD